LASAAVAEGTGMLGSIVSVIGNAFGRIYDYIKSVIDKVLDLLKDFALWYVNTLIEKPEYGITLTALIIYMIT